MVTRGLRLRAQLNIGAERRRGTLLGNVGDSGGKGLEGSLHWLTSGTYTVKGTATQENDRPAGLGGACQCRDLLSACL